MISGEYNITSKGTDGEGRYISLGEAAPVEGITIDEVDGTVVIHEERGDIQRIIEQLVALERDRLLGYQSDELHEDPKTVLSDALDTLEQHGADTDKVVMPEDKQALGLTDNQ